MEESDTSYFHLLSSPHDRRWDGHKTVADPHNPNLWIRSQFFESAGLADSLFCLVRASVAAPQTRKAAPNRMHIKLAMPLSCVSVRRNTAAARTRIAPESILMAIPQTFY
jgi:hypothetical protein